MKDQSLQFLTFHGRPDQLGTQQNMLIYKNCYKLENLIKITKLIKIQSMKLVKYKNVIYI